MAPEAEPTTEHERRADELTREAPADAPPWRHRPDLAIALALFACALVVRLYFNLAAHRPGDFVFSDMWVYDHRAGHLYDRAPYAWDTFTPVGYPALLALLFRAFGRDYAAIGVVQAIVGSAVPALTFVIGRQATRSRAVAAAAGAVMTLYVPHIYYGGLLLTEIPFTFLLLLMTASLLWAGRRRSWRAGALAGLFFSMGVIVRPNLLVALPAVLAYLWVVLGRDAKRVARSGALFVAAALPVILWASVHNSRVLGRATGLGTNGGLNFFLAHSDLRGASYDEPTPEGTRHHEIVPIPNSWRSPRMYVSPVPLYDEPHFYRETFRHFRREPFQAFTSLDNLLEGFGLGRLDYWPAWPPLARSLRVLSRAAFWWLILPAGLYVLALLLLRRLVRPEESATLLIALLGFSVVPTLYLFLGDPRLRVPFDPFFVLLTADGLSRGRAALAWLRSRAV